MVINPKLSRATKRFLSKPQGKGTALTGEGNRAIELRKVMEKKKNARIQSHM